MTGFSRREFLEMTAALSVGCCAAPPALRASTRSLATRRSVIVVDQVGGNDGWNTLVRPAAPSYRELRPGLALPAGELLPLGRGVGLHPALAPLASAWRAGELALCEGVAEAGRRVAHHCASAHYAAAGDRLPGVVLADAVGLDAPSAWTPPGGTGTPAEGVLGGDGLTASWVMAGTSDVEQTPLQKFRAQHGPALLPHGGRTVDGLRGRLEFALREMRGPRPPALLRVAQYGYDTHLAQEARHAERLAELASGIAWLRGKLREAGMWDRVLVMTRSEMGRSLAENTAGGTDHGPVGVRLLLGGGLRGGVYGVPPDTRADTQAGTGSDLRPSLSPADFARLLARNWWGSELAPGQQAASGALHGIV